MKSFFSFQRTRYTAAAMLFVWLMSIGISLANACLVQQDHELRDYFSQGHSGTDLTAQSKRGAARDHLGKKSGYSDPDEHTSSPEKITCLHFCVAEQSTLITDHQDELAHPDLVPVLFLTGLPVPTTDQPSPVQASTRPNWSERPVSIRYLRLTI